MNKTPGQAMPRESFARIKRTVSRYPAIAATRPSQGSQGRPNTPSNPPRQ